MDDVIYFFPRSSMLCFSVITEYKYLQHNQSPQKEDFMFQRVVKKSNHEHERREQ